MSDFPTAAEYWHNAARPQLARLWTEAEAAAYLRFTLDWLYLNRAGRAQFKSGYCPPTIPYVLRSDGAYYDPEDVFAFFARFPTKDGRPGPSPSWWRAAPKTARSS